VERVLPAVAFASLDAYVTSGGGTGLTAARAVEPDVVIAEVEASGLRGRGGAGFPTGTKWRTVAAYGSSLLATTVVVNAAEGEPGTFKDRAILRANPYAMLEGALIAAHAVGANEIVFATKARFVEQLQRVRSAIDELTNAGWTKDVAISIVEGPAEYLYGEETALLEVIDGRPPFPRIAPPYRRGVVEVLTDDDVDSESGLSADVEMATTDDETLAPPVLANNVETLANVPAIVANGASWFRSIGTTQSPGTIVVTLTGDVLRPGVGEVAMGSRLRDVIEEVAGGVAPGRSVAGVLGGVSTAVLNASQLDVTLSYEAMAEAGSALGSASFHVIDSEADVTALAAGVSRFLAIESCGQCTPCKQDGLVIADGLSSLCHGDGTRATLTEIRERLGTVADGARCALGRQHQTVVASLLDAFPGALESRLAPGALAIEPVLVAELTGIEGDTEVVDETFRDKQPDWTYDADYSGKAPVDRLTDHRERPEA